MILCYDMSLHTLLYYYYICPTCNRVPGVFCSWLWVEGAAQLKMEESLGIGGFGYPAMAAVNSRKMKYALLKGAFSASGIHDFLR